jgi:hypothetical protein
LSPSITSTSATQGGTSSPITLTATPTAGFQSTIAFACTGGLPARAVCLFTPSTVALTGNTPATTSLTISSAATGPQASAPVNRDSSRRVGVTSGFGVSLACLFLFVLPRRTRRWSVFTLLFALSTLGVLSGCGSGAVDPNGLNPSSLSAGSYAVTVTATGGATIQTATISLTIQ